MLGTEITDELTLKVFNIVWTTLTVLWFMQIAPKLLAAANPDGYLDYLRGVLFPIVEFVRKIGIGQPGEWTSLGIQNRLGWHGEQGIEEEAPARRGETLASAWATLVPESAPRRPRSSDE
jgi:hypothetical protein